MGVAGAQSQIVWTGWISSGDTQLTGYQANVTITAPSGQRLQPSVDSASPLLYIVALTSERGTHRITISITKAGYPPETLDPTVTCR